MDPEQLTTLSVPSPDPQNQSGNHHNVFPVWTKSRILGPKRNQTKRYVDNMEQFQIFTIVVNSCYFSIDANMLQHGCHVNTAIWEGA